MYNNTRSNSILPLTRCFELRTPRIDVIVGLVLIAVTGCKTTEGESACAWFDDPAMCQEAGDDEASDAGDGDAPCILAPDGAVRAVHQCTGTLDATLSFTAIGKTCSEHLGSEGCVEEHVFGLGVEPYELAKVIACCDPYEPETSDIDVYIDYCSADMTQQICHTISTRIKNLIDDGQLPKTAESTALQTYIAENEDECYSALWAGNVTMVPGQLQSSWTVPNKAAWAAVIQDLTVTVNSGVISDITAPELESDFIECDGIDYNNDQIFEEAAQPTPVLPLHLQLASVSRLGLTGPTIIDDPVVGLGLLASAATGCLAPFCSDASIAIDPKSSTGTIEDLNLFVDGTFTLSSGTSTFAIDRGSVRLYGVSSGRHNAGPNSSSLEFPPRSMVFTVAGASGAGVRLVLMSNSTSVVAKLAGGTWTLEKFSLDYIDRSGDTWLLAVPATTWK